MILLSLMIVCLMCN